MFIQFEEFIQDYSENLRDAIFHLWLDISRYGPPSSLPDLHSLGLFEVPPLPPPPPPPPPIIQLSYMHKSFHWLSRHPWSSSGILLALLGTGLLAGYRIKRSTPRNLLFKERRQVVVILGGDTPLGLSLIAEFEKKGYIVITSVSTPDAVDAIQHDSHGYVRALVLDPNQPATIPIFLRSLSSTLSRRFPITASGDPHASPSTHPYIHSVISLLTLPAPIVPAPLEHISLRNAYLPYLNATHITPLQVLQALLPMLRSTPARSRDNYNPNKTIIVCLPAADARVGLPFASVQAMSAAATLRGVEVMRREINAAAVTDMSESMKNIKVLVLDVGAINPHPHSLPPHDVYKAMEHWTPSEKLTYGPAFASISLDPPPPRLGYSWPTLSSIFSDRFQFGVGRKPTEVAVFVDTILAVVTGKRYGPSIFGVQLGLSNWSQFSIGAGATTYRLASHLPSIILDTLLNIPHHLVSIRNALLPVPPPIVRPMSPTPAAPAPVTLPGRNDTDTGSEADAESNFGESDSWVSLKARQEEA